MALLKDTVISGSLRATDTIYTTTLQAQIINAPTTSNGTTYGPGTNGYMLKSNGTSVYWSSLDTSGTWSGNAAKATADGSGNNIVNTYLTKAAGVTNVAYDTTNKKITKTINGTTSDVVTIAKIKTDLALAKADVGLGNVTNDAQIPKSIGTNKGDLIYFSAASTPTRLGIGAAGEFLKVKNSSGELEWGDGSTVTLNGVSTTTASFYAPTTAGTSGYYLKSNGSGAPTWGQISINESIIGPESGINSSITADTDLWVDTSGESSTAYALRCDSIKFFKCTVNDLAANTNNIRYLHFSTQTSTTGFERTHNDILLKTIYGITANDVVVSINIIDGSKFLNGSISWETSAGKIKFTIPTNDQVTTTDKTIVFYIVVAESLGVQNFIEHTLTGT